MTIFPNLQTWHLKVQTSLRFMDRMKMIRGLLLTVLFSVLAACATAPTPPVRLDQANVLPLAINDNFQFRKILTSFNDPDDNTPTASEWATFHRRYMRYGAIGRYQLDQVTGNFFTFFWRALEAADVTIRLEYRQSTLGNKVLAMERYYPAAKGSFRTPFEVAGDDYFEFGRVNSWRVLLIVEGKIVALRQSYAWK